MSRGWQSIRRRVQATREIWRPGDRHLAMLGHPKPRSLKLPGGHLDLPFADSEVADDHMLIRGWAMFPSGLPARVDIWLGDHELGPARLGAHRPDVEVASGLSSGMAAQFEEVADLRRVPAPGGRLTVRAVAVSVDGERFELPPVRVRVMARDDPPGGRELAPDHPAEPPLPLPLAADRDEDEPLRVLVFTHQLDLGGAQLYLLDLLAGLREATDFEFTVVSPLDGPLRERLEALGVRVHLSSPIPIHDADFYASRVNELAAWAAHGRHDVVFVNTALAFAGADVARLLGLPVVWSIHESYDPSMLWWLFGPTFDPEVRRRAELVLANTAVGLFEGDGTRRQYEPYMSHGRCVTLPYGLDLSELEERRRGFDRAAARRKRSIRQDAQVVLCVGTIEPRKGQLPLVQAFALIADRHPHAQLVFVGGRHDEHTHLLERFVATSGERHRVKVLPVTPDIWSWYALADLLVCASDVESTPRSVLEAMIWETPVLGTAVFGLPELIDHGVNGWLCPPRDVRAMADALDAALSAGDEERHRIGTAGRELVERRHDQATYAEACAKLLSDAAAGRSLAVEEARAR